MSRTQERMPTYIRLGNAGLNKDRLIGLEVINLGGNGNVHHIIAVMAGQVRDSGTQMELSKDEHPYQKSEHTMTIDKYYSESEARAALDKYLAKLNN